jgi:hypothetical protein
LIPVVRVVRLYWLDTSGFNFRRILFRASSIHSNQLKRLKVWSRSYGISECSSYCSSKCPLWFKDSPFVITEISDIDRFSPRLNPCQCCSKLNAKDTYFSCGVINNFNILDVFLLVRIHCHRCTQFVLSVICWKISYRREW